MGNQKGGLNQLFKAKQQEMLSRLVNDRAVIRPPGLKGQATEESWRGLLTHYLPWRYQVDTGIVIDANDSQSDQMDVIIFDRQYSPRLFKSGGVIYVPAESVYSVFEVKQDLDKGNLEYAADKIQSVRKLRRTSAPIVHAGGEFPPKELFKIIGGILVTESAWNPPFGSSLVETLSMVGESGRIDLGCSLKDGGFLASYDDLGSVQLDTSQSEFSLVTFVLQLLSILQGLGTVPAIDYAKYLKRVQ